MTERTPHHRRKSFDSYMEVFRQLEKEYRNENYTSKQQAFIKRQLLSIYNGMKQNEVASILKKDLKKLESITWIDRLRVGVSSFRNRRRIR
jgi:flagellar motility protein MotE (MotC chaperone)